MNTQYIHSLPVNSIFILYQTNNANNIGTRAYNDKNICFCKVLKQYRQYGKLTDYVVLFQVNSFFTNNNQIHIVEDYSPAKIGMSAKEIINGESLEPIDELLMEFYTFTEPSNMEVYPISVGEYIIHADIGII